MRYNLYLLTSIKVIKIFDDGLPFSIFSNTLNVPSTGYRELNKI